MGKFARQICNKFTGVQILCKSRWKFARVQINMQIYGKFNLTNLIFARRQTIGKSSR